MSTATITAMPTDEQSRRIVALAREGRTTGEIATELGLPAHTVKRVRADAGLQASVGRPATGQRDRIMLRLSDEAFAELDAEAEVHESTRAAIAAEVLERWADRRRRR